MSWPEAVAEAAKWLSGAAMVWAGAWFFKHFLT